MERRLPTATGQKRPAHCTALRSPSKGVSGTLLFSQGVALCSHKGNRGPSLL